MWKYLSFYFIAFLVLGGLLQPTIAFAATTPTPTAVSPLQIQPNPAQAEPGQPINVTLSHLPETVIKGQEMACVSLQNNDGFEVAGSEVKLIITDNSYLSHLETSPHTAAGRYQLVVTICGSGENYPATREGATIFAQPYTITASTGQFDDIQRIISPDNQWTAIVNLTQGSLDVVSSTGQTQTMFAAGSTVDSVNWSPNSDELLVVLTHRIYLQPLGSGVISNKPLELWGISFKNNQPDKPRLLFSSPQFNPDMAEQLVFGSWSPDGQHLLFWVSMLSASIMSDGLTPYMLDLTSQKATQIGADSLINEQYHSWSPDGSQLAMTVGAGRETWQNKWLMLYDTRTATATMLISQSEQIPGAVAWSPDGETLAYTAISSTVAPKATSSNGFDNPGIAQRRIYLLDLKTKQYHRLDDVDRFQDMPTWGINGTLYYVQQLTNTHFALMALDGWGQTQENERAVDKLTQGTYYGLADWHFFSSFLPTDSRLYFLTSPKPTDMEVVRFIFTHQPIKADRINDILWSEVADAQYTDFTRQEADVTGDGQADIIFSGSINNRYMVYMAILTRPKGQTNWQVAFYTDSDSWYDSDVAVKIEGQRVKVDFLTSWGGTGTLSIFWLQHWIECAIAKGCQEIWQAPILQTGYVVNNTIESSYEVSQVTQPQANIIQVTTQRFGIKDLPTMRYNHTSVETGVNLAGTRLMSGPNSSDIYQRDADGKFTLISHEQNSPGLEVSRQFNLASDEARLWFNMKLAPFLHITATTTNKEDEARQGKPDPLDDGMIDDNSPHQQATLAAKFMKALKEDEARWGKPNRQADGVINDSNLNQEATWAAKFVSALDAPLCRLTAYQFAPENSTSIGQVELPCISNFSQLSQADVDGDGKAELLFLTLHPELDDISEIQTLHVYHVGTELTEMTTLTGTINGADGVGIRWEKDKTGKLTFLTGLPLVKWRGCGNKMLSCATTERRFERYQWQK